MNSIIVHTHENNASLGFHLPERATMSLALKPLLPNKETSLSRLSLKLGRLVAARLRPEVVESLLPSFTVHVGPLTYLIHMGSELIFNSPCNRYNVEVNMLRVNN